MGNIFVRPEQDLTWPFFDKPPEHPEAKWWDDQLKREFHRADQIVRRWAYSEGSFKDFPDGEGYVGKKSWMAFKRSFWAGSLAICVWSAVIGRRNWKHYLWRVQQSVPPFVGGVTFYEFTANVSCIQRKKDDHINHMIGGVAGGLLYGAMSSSIPLGGVAVVFGSVTAGIYKYFSDRNINVMLTPNAIVHHENEGFNQPWFNYSVYDDRSGPEHTDAYIKQPIRFGHELAANRFL